MKKFLWYIFPPIAWMMFIFSLSSRTRVGVSDTYLVNFLIFKSLHIIEYCILFFLNLRAFHAYSPQKKQKIFLYAFIATLIFAISDEFHQTFVPTRQGSLRDIFIDTLGIGLCFMYTKNNLKKLKYLL